MARPKGSTTHFFKLSKLGTTIVEALPDRALVDKIEKHYKRTGKVLKVKPTPTK
jgi:hypothetical protein